MRDHAALHTTASAASTPVTAGPGSSAVTPTSTRTTASEV